MLLHDKGQIQRQKVLTQLGRAKWIYTRSRLNNEPFRTWSAKTGEDGKIIRGAKDNLIFVLGMAIYWAKTRQSSE
jgi:hypothetical protein